MKIKAFITDASQLNRLLAHLKLPSQRAPPKIRYSVPLVA
jgi:hypothetical protein